MIPMKKFMKNEGFTLVELIVVIAILGILAAVAVPAYTGYLSKAKDTAAVTELSAIKTAADAAAALEGDTVTQIDVTTADGKVAVTCAGGSSVTVNAFYAPETKTLKDALADHSVYGASTNKGARWTSAGWAGLPKT